MRRQTQTVHPFRSFIYSFPTQQDCVFRTTYNRGAAASITSYLSAIQYFPRVSIARYMHSYN